MRTLFMSPLTVHVTVFRACCMRDLSNGRHSRSGGHRHCDVFGSCQKGKVKNSIKLLEVSLTTVLHHIHYTTTTMPRHLLLMLVVFMSSASSIRAFAPIVVRSIRQQSTATTLGAKKKPSSAAGSSNTGGLRRLPVVKAPDELMNRAKKVQRSIRADR